MVAGGGEWDHQDVFAVGHAAGVRTAAAAAAAADINLPRNLSPHQVHCLQRELGDRLLHTQVLHRRVRPSCLFVTFFH